MILKNITKLKHISIIKIAESALSFDGLNEGVSLAHDPVFDFNGTTPFTISSKIRFKSTTKKTYLATKMLQGSPYRGFSFAIEGATGILSMTMRNVINSNDLTTNVATNISLNSLHTLSVTYDGSQSIFGVKFYLDDVLLTGYANVRNNLNATLSNTEPLRVGHSFGNFSDFEDGYLRMWNVELTESEIIEDVTRGVFGGAVRQANLVTFCDFTSIGGFFNGTNWELPSGVGASVYLSSGMDFINKLRW